MKKGRKKEGRRNEEGRKEEGKISHDLLFAIWRARKAGDVIQPKSQGPRTRGEDDVNSSPKDRTRLDEMFQFHP